MSDPLRTGLAATVGAAVAEMTTLPIDISKVRLQTQQKAGGAAKYTNMFQGMWVSAHAPKAPSTFQPNSARTYLELKLECEFQLELELECELELEFKGDRAGRGGRGSVERVGACAAAADGLHVHVLRDLRAHQGLLRRQWHAQGGDPVLQAGSGGRHGGQHLHRDDESHRRDQDANAGLQRKRQHSTAGPGRLRRGRVAWVLAGMVSQRCALLCWQRSGDRVLRWLQELAAVLQGHAGRSPRAFCSVSRRRDRQRHLQHARGRRQDPAHEPVRHELARPSQVQRSGRRVFEHTKERGLRCLLLGFLPPCDAEDRLDRCILHGV
mmetsp:Transcript_7960/g.29790  ORF Transcript_7960/g.29790 Transcript_7960/m.29790 type:complete len:324 (-) Transcript_7960:161-1132(-)